jgi:hypothetical protein
VGAAITVTDAAGEQSLVRTDIDGLFVAGPMNVGLASVRVVRSPDVDLSVSTMVIAAAETEVSFPSLTCAPPAPDEDTTPTPTPLPDEVTPSVGHVEGRVCAPDGNTYLAGATVYIDAQGIRYETTSNGDGDWRLTGVPVGVWTAHVIKSSFHATLEVVVSSGQVYVVPESECSVGQDHLKIAIVDGDWDNVYDVLLNVGIDPGIVSRYDGRQGDNNWAGTLLGDYTLLASYDMVLINCGAAEDGFFANPVYVDNLKQFISSGGSLYASDWAYDFVEKAFPTAIDFYRDDLWRNDAERGKAVPNVVASIPDLTLSAAMGQSSFVLHHQWDQWTIMNQVGANVRVYVSGPAIPVVDGVEQPTLQVPYTVGFSHGAGRVFYTSFHQEEANMNPETERILQLLVFEL